MHPLGRHILKELTYQDRVRYTDLRPQGTPSNRFTYHLNKLVHDGLVAKHTDGYALTASGKRHVDKLSLASFAIRMQPKVVTVLICDRADGMTLLYRRGRQPFLGKVSFPYGKVHFGETVAEAARRELKEKAGLIGSPQHRGDVYLTVYQDGALAAHMLCHVFTAPRVTGMLRQPSSAGTAFWGRIADLEPDDLVPGFAEIRTLAKRSKTRFFKELTFGA